MRKQASIAAAVVAASALGLAACSSSPSASSGSKSSSATTTLTLENSPSGPVSRDFNPFSPTGAGTILGSNTMIYEPLLQFDILKPGTIYPWLATSYAWSNGGKTITFHIRPGVKFTNGTPFTASDVAFVFNMIKKNPGINSGGLSITGATAPNASTAVISFSTPSYVLLYYIANTPMVPQSVWSKVNPVTFPDTNPVGTGPYKLSSFSPQAIILTRNPHYWQPGEPHIDKLDFPAYNSNTSANLALEQGTLDWGGNFVQDIKQAYIDKDPSVNHYWDAPVQTETLIPNLTEFPFNILAVRQAVSLGVNRQVISAVGEDGQQPPVQGPGSLTGLTLPNDAPYVTSATSGYTAAYNPAQAKAILVKAGFKMGSNGFFVAPNGKELAFTIEDPSPYTDFITDDQIMASELKKIGIDVTVDGTSVQKWTTDLADGTFQAIAHWGNSGPSPYYLYNNWLNSAIGAPIGKPANGDYERFSSKQADTLLAQFASSNSPATQQSAIVGIEKIVATQLPVIPLFYGVAWDEYHTNKFTGWPTPSNQYAPGEPSPPFNEITVLHLKPVS